MCKFSTQCLYTLDFSFFFSWRGVLEVPLDPPPSLMSFPLFLLSLVLNISTVFLMSFIVLLISGISFLSFYHIILLTWPIFHAYSLCLNWSYQPLNDSCLPGSSSDNSRICFASKHLSLFLWLVSFGTSSFGACLVISVEFDSRNWNQLSLLERICTNFTRTWALFGVGAS